MSGTEPDRRIVGVMRPDSVPLTRDVGYSGGGSSTYGEGFALVLGFATVVSGFAAVDLGIGAVTIGVR